MARKARELGLENIDELAGISFPKSADKWTEHRSTGECPGTVDALEFPQRVKTDHSDAVGNSFPCVAPH
jgi:hypothetical protein